MTTKSPTDSYAAYAAYLAQHGEKPLGEMPAAMLIARTMAALKEQRENFGEVITAAVEAVNHIANQLRLAGELIDQGHIAEAREIIASQAKPLDAALLTSIVGGGQHVAH
jgi:hypothetical protein